MAGLILQACGMPECVNVDGESVTPEEVAAAIRGQSSWGAQAVNGVVELSPPKEGTRGVSVISYDRGHEIGYDGKTGRMFYVDTGDTCTGDRACIRCGQTPTPEGYDACAGYIEGARYACCGHGVTKSYLIMKDGTEAQHPTERGEK